jgi:hypothetical protein
MAGAQDYVLKAPDGNVIFAADSDILVVRGVQTRGGVRYELVFANGQGRIQCIAHDAAGQPLAAEHANMSYGYVAFDGIDPPQIADVACRWRN